MKHTKEETAQAREFLLSHLTPGDTVYTIIRNVSRSGMSREIGIVIKSGDQFFHPNYHTSVLLDLPLGKRDGVKISGCGMDMGFEIVYQLGRKLFPKGFKVDGRGRNGDTSGWDKDGGYALKQQWL